MHDFLVDAECLLEVRIYVGYELVCVYQDHWKRAFCEKCFLDLGTFIVQVMPKST